MCFLLLSSEVRNEMFCFFWDGCTLQYNKSVFFFSPEKMMQLNLIRLNQSSLWTIIYRHCIQVRERKVLVKAEKGDTSRLATVSFKRGKTFKNGESFFFSSAQNTEYFSILMTRVFEESGNILRTWVSVVRGPCGLFKVH